MTRALPADLRLEGVATFDPLSDIAVAAPSRSPIISPRLGGSLSPFSMRSTRSSARCAMPARRPSSKGAHNMAAKKTTYTTIGDLSIDTGTLLLCDPCNVEGGTEWVYEKMLKGERFAARVDKHGVTVALAVLTGIGDGCYRTVVRYEDSPVFGRRIAEVKIQFL
jgi:hypothetical protein